MYVRLANQVFEKKFPEEQKQTTINYITFHQKFRKVYVINMTEEEALLKYQLEEQKAAVTQNQTLGNKTGFHYYNGLEII